MEISTATTVQMTALPRPVDSTPQSVEAPAGPAWDAPAQNRPANSPGAPVTEAEKARDAAMSPEEVAIRAAFLAQLANSELLTIVRDPADNMLPGSPDIDG